MENSQSDDRLMPKKYISMLRGINVSGQKSIRMAELKSLYEGLGLLQVRTYVQSGNVLFESPEPDASKLAAQIEGRIEQTYGYRVAVFMRTGEDLERIVQNNPFLTKRNEDPAKLHVTFLYSMPLAAKMDQLALSKGESDEFFVGVQEIYLFCPNGYGRTRLSNTFFEKKLDVPATTRNWNTVSSLCQMILS